MTSDRVRVTADRIDLLGTPPRDVVPASVQDSLTARLDRLGVGRSLAQLAATVGREFTYDMLRDLGMFDVEGLRRELDGLVSAGIVAPDPSEEGRYTFRHVLFRDTAYQSLLRATRQRYHNSILHVLTDRSPDIAAMRPELLAQHYAGAGLIGEAIEHWRMAGQSSAARSALRESEANYRRALEQLDTLAPSGERDRREVDLRTGLGLALVQTQGFATRDIELNYARASELCARATEVPFPVLLGVWTVVFVRGDRTGVDRVEPQMRKVAETTDDPTIRLVARSSLASAAYYSNRHRDAVAHGDLAVQSFEGRAPRDMLPTLLAYGSEALLYGHLYRAIAEATMGRRESALRGMREALAIADETALPYMIAMANGFAAGIAVAAEEPAMAREFSVKALEIASQNGLMFWVAASKSALGWARARLGDPAGGAEDIKFAISMMRAIGSTVVLPQYFGFLAEALWLLEDFSGGLAAADEGIAFARGSLAGDRTPSELLWHRGVLLSRLKRNAEAAEALREAIAAATVSEAEPTRAHAAEALRQLEAT